MPTPRDLLLARLATTRTALDEVVAHLTPEVMTGSPRDGMRTVAGQLVEIAATEVQILARVKEQPVPSDDEVRARIGAYEDLATLRAFLRIVRNETLGYLDSLSDAQLAASVDIKGWHESIGRPEMPRHEIFVSVCQHEAYHTGQLVSYLWAAGDNPYDW